MTPNTNSKSLAVAVAALFTTAGTLGLSAQGFRSGSDGSHGALNIAIGSTTNLVVPPDGIFHFTTVFVGGSATVRFTPNALNTPVYILATGDVLINGTIDVRGGVGTGSAGGLGGPGGFNGGNPGTPTSPPGDGYGPGGGKGGLNCRNSSDCAGGGSYGAISELWANTTNAGRTYGSPLLIPLVGGSGGGGVSYASTGNPGAGGPGGGGAILIASTTRIELNGWIIAQGGLEFFLGNGGSGGAVRLVAPVTAGSGSGRIFVNAVQGQGNLSVGGGAGRARIDSLNRSAFTGSVIPAASGSFGKVMTVFPPVPSRLSILSAAGQLIPEGTNAPVTVMLPFGSDTNQIVRVQARDFAGVVPISVVVTPQNGPRQMFPAEIDMAAGNPAFANVAVTIPLNTEAAIHAWTR